MTSTEASSVVTYSDGARVAVVQRIVPHYRVAFFDALHAELAVQGVELLVIHGQSEPGAVPRSVTYERPWSKFLRNRMWRVASQSLVWQPVLCATRDADLVIVEHAARLACNYALHARRMVSGQRLAYWGHGANFQASRPDSIMERMKRLMMRQVDWWFAYTALSQAAVRAVGFPEERITVVQNAIDGAELEAGLRAVSPDRIATEKRRLGIVGARVGLYCGGMYPDKRLDFVIEACLRLREGLPDFEMVFVGAGPDEPLVRQACARHTWMHQVGAVFGDERALYFAMAQVLLMPGAVGLAIIDSFAAGTPLFTTQMPTHGPEIAYLAPDINGVITEPDVEDYVRAVVEYLSDPAALARLREGCRAAAAMYTLEAMTRNFAAGVQACLAAERR